MDKTGWIKLHRTLLDWDWADDPKVFALFVTCLLKANHEPNTWRGIASSVANSLQALIA